MGKSIIQAKVTKVVKTLLGGKAPKLEEVRRDTPLQHYMAVRDSASGVAVPHCLSSGDPTTQPERKIWPKVESLT